MDVMLASLAPWRQFQFTRGFATCLQAFNQVDCRMRRLRPQSKRMREASGLRAASRFRRLHGRLRTERALHLAKAVSSMQACALHLCHRSPRRCRACAGPWVFGALTSSSAHGSALPFSLAASVPARACQIWCRQVLSERERPAADSEVRAPGGFLPEDQASFRPNLFVLCHLLPGLPAAFEHKGVLDR